MLQKKLLLVGAILGTAFNASAAPVLVPNGNFDSPDGDLWGEGGTENTGFFYPTTGGISGGYAEMENNGSGFGVLVANEGEDPDLSLDSLGLTAGQSYRFFQDMRLIAGSTIGGIKIEYFSEGVAMGSSGDTFIPLIGDGSTWETYSYTVPIPAGTDAVRVVPLWGSGSTVGYDNIGVDNTPIDIPVPDPIPNFDFEIQAPSQWSFFQQGSNGAPHTVTFRETGGNPGGYAEIDASATGGFAGITANSNTPIQLSALGLTPGETYTFQVDMRIISGSNIGKFKVEFIPTGTGDLSTDLIGDGSTWETYSFDITIPSTSTQIFIVPLWGTDSVVGYDNVRVVVPVEEPFRADIESGTLLSWTLMNAESSYQPQTSENGEDWVNFGSALSGGVASSVFDANGAPFYRVEQTALVPFDNILNGSFEDEGDDLCPDAWTCIQEGGSSITARNTTDARTGDASVRLAIDNVGVIANKAEIQQLSGSVLPGEGSDFSFWAKQVRNDGDSYKQEYQIQWLGANGFISNAFDPAIVFTGGDGEWVEFSHSDLMPPEGATNALIQINAVTGAIDGAFGEVLIDDVAFTALEVDSTEIIESTTAPGVEISWPSDEGKNYQVQSSIGLDAFSDFGSAFSGNGATQSISDATGSPANFYKVIESE